MCWCEQISPLAHSSQGTWQPFNVSHCIEMHNTHLLGRAGQLSQAYFTQSPPILTLRNLPPTVNKQWPPLWESRVTSHSLQHQPKNGNCRDERYISWYKCSWQSIRPSARIRFCISIVSKMSKSYLKCDSLICHREAHPTLVKPGRAGPTTPAWSQFCFLSSRDVVWLISTQNPSCVALHNVWFDSFVA